MGNLRLGNLRPIPRRHQTLSGIDAYGVLLLGFQARPCGNLIQSATAAGTHAGSIQNTHFDAG